MQVLDKGSLGLLGMLGDDYTIAKAAWVSYGKQDRDTDSEAVGKVINFMMKHKHGTPFEHVVFQFHVKAPIFVAREWFRHRIGSFNEISGRYVTFEPEFYVPDQFRVKSETNKQGSIVPTDDWFSHNKGYGINAMGPDSFRSAWNNVSNDLLDKSYRESYNAYKALLDGGVANELARLTMPVGMYTQWWWTVNLRSLFNFMALRSEETAQWEIRQYSEALEQIVQKQIPMAYNTWVSNGRVAP